MLTINIKNLKILMLFSYEVPNIISKKLNANDNICDLPKKYFEFLKKFEKLYAKEFGSKHEDYRDIYQQEQIKYINNKLNMLPIQKELSKLDLKKSNGF